MKKTPAIIAERLNVSIDQARKIRALFDGDIQPKDFPTVEKWINSCYNEPSRHEQVMEALNVIMGGYGVEILHEKDEDFHDCPLSYVNMGDTYTPTICYYNGKYHYCSWGDAIEKLETEGIVFN